MIWVCSVFHFQGCHVYAKDPPNPFLLWDFIVRGSRLIRFYSGLSKTMASNGPVWWWSRVIGAEVPIQACSSIRKTFAMYIQKLLNPFLSWPLRYFMMFMAFTRQVVWDYYSTLVRQTRAFRILGGIADAWIPKSLFVEQERLTSAFHIDSKSNGPQFDDGLNLSAELTARFKLVVLFYIYN